MPKRLFTTADLPLVAFLRLNNYSISKIQREDGGRAFFTLEDDSKRETLVLKFFNRETTIEPLSYLDQIRNLKSLIRQNNESQKLAKETISASSE